MELDSFQLKMLAIATMAVDHIGAVFFPQYMIFRYIGRIAFPIFCFLLTEGFFHTRNIRKYMVRLGLFALISEIPYDLAFQGEILEFGRQNVFFTLFIGVAMMYAFEKSTEWPVKAVEILLAMWFASTVNSDYGYKGILLIAVYYILHERKWEQLIFGALWNVLWGSVQVFGVLSSIPIALYRGKKGLSMKYFFYAFYPLHLMVLYLVSHYGWG